MADLDLGTLKGSIDLDMDRFERKYRAVIDLLQDLASDPIPDLKLDLDIVGAQTAVDRIDAAVRAIPDGKVDVTADISGAESALDDVADKASAAGTEAGDGAGKNLAGGIVAALATIPIAGAVVGIGAAIGSSILDGLQAEVRTDLFSARTGLDEATAARFARAAGEAYAGNFGESIAANMDAARIAVQSGLLDPEATARDAQDVLEQLTGISDLLGEEYPAVARAAAQAIKTGIAGDAAGAFDLLARGTQVGLNVSEDLLDTVTEYGTQFRNLGLEGPQALGLLSQAVNAGARDTDIAADALKELAVRAADPAMAAGFEAIGVSQADIAQGGPRASAALGDILDRLRDIEDPAKRNAAAIELFGTQAEDLGDALYAMDLTTAADQFGAVAGAARNALDVMGDNAAAQIESARRNIEVAANGIKGALAAAFADEATDAAQWVQRNRGPLMEFLLNAVNGGIDLGRSIAQGMATGGAGVGEFLAGPAADFLDALAAMTEQVGFLFGADQDTIDGLREAGDALRASGDAMVDTSKVMEQEWVGTLDAMQEKANAWAAPEILSAHIHDAVLDAQSRLDELSATIDSTGGTVTINGNQVPAQEALDVLVGNIDESDGTVTINGNRVPASDALDTLMGLIRSSQGDVTIGGNSTTARGEVAGFKVWSSTQQAWVPVDADTSAATAAIDAWTSAMSRTRSVRIQTITENGGNTGGGFWTGGYTGAGGKFEPAGTVHRGEFVINAEETAEHRPLLEAIHAGRDLPGFTSGGYVDAALAAARSGQYLPVAADGGTAVATVGAPAPAAAPANVTYNVNVYPTAGRALRPVDVVNALKDFEANRGPRP
ncbi:phage tail tape measure protein [Cellulomonas sp. ATA003]|uniref:phage tail tape measure protein n=1 Tax=Cellulomonas sp. ATA003 TaxID=3073064 RepID=UPI0028737448|nr:phage tail tape measure protein [Cellulomonas sp. ATA003]WNB84532.1 phage tail tape measure protein [Cellulomonas sp. ATA003]